jgi:AAA domain
MSNGFPRHLLKQSIAERLDYFKQYTVFHPKLREAHDALLSAIQEPGDASLIFVYGPTGIGKTTLRLRVQQKLIEAALPELEDDRGRMPVVGMELKTSGTRNFNWKEYFTGALIALEEPLIDRKISYGVQGVARNSAGELTIQNRVVAPEMRRALENALRHRRPDIFFIDEAQHLAKIASGHTLEDQLDCIKSLSNTTGILHGLIGTYELRIFRNLSGQLGRRSIDIHFKRYHQDSKQDIREFMNVIKSLQNQMPLEETPNLLEHGEYIYIGTLGCVGILKSWLTRAFKEALEKHATTVTIEHVEKHILSVDTLENMLREINEGEKLFEETDSDRNRLRMALGFAPIISSTSNESDTESVTPSPEQTPATKPTRKRKVGQRKPKRDPVGSESNAS